MKKAILSFITIIALLLLTVTSTQLVINYNSVTQTVEHGSFEKYMIERIYRRMPDMRIDSSEFYSFPYKKYCEYRLTTTYKGYSNVVIGDYNEIQNIKCSEAKNIINDKINSDKIELIKEQEREAEEKRQEKLLEELNKPCE